MAVTIIIESHKNARSFKLKILYRYIGVSVKSMMGIFEFREKKLDVYK
jgi:hypothetical protein